MMHPWMILPTLVVLMMGAGTASAQSDPVFRASAFGCGSDIQTSNAGVLADQPVATCNPWSMEGARAQAGPGGLGVTAEHWHYCCATASSAGATASVQTEFYVAGPPGVVTLSLNLALSGSMATGSTGDAARSQIRIDVIMGGANAFGLFREQQEGGVVTHTFLGPLAPGPLACTNPCILTTPTVDVVANSWVPLSIVIDGLADGGTGFNQANVRAGDTLYFPIGSPVFNLPDGYTAAIPDMDVENNQVVPEPASAMLLGSGIVGLVVVARRRVRRSA